MIARRKQSLESVAKTHDFPAELLRSEHDAAQDRVKSRAIATAGQDANARLHFWNRAINSESFRELKHFL
jgi:hypothetical protein